MAGESGPLAGMGLNMTAMVPRARSYAALLLLVAALAWLTGPPVMHAQQLPAHVYSGEARVDSRPPPNGTVVSAWVNGQVVAQTTVENGRYTLMVELSPGHLDGGRSVTYRIGGVQTGEIRDWTPGGATEVDLFSYIHQGASGGPDRLPGRFIRACDLNALGWSPSSKDDLTAQDLITAVQLCPSLKGRMGALEGDGGPRPDGLPQPAANAPGDQVFTPVFTHVFNGKALLFGRPAEDGTGIAAFIDGVNISGARTKDGRFRLVVPQLPGKSFQGRIVEFKGSTAQGRRFDWLGSAVWRGGESFVTLGPDVRFSTRSPQSVPERSLDPAAVECIRGTLGYAPSSTQAMNGEESRRVQVSCFGGGPNPAVKAPDRDHIRGFFTNSTIGSLGTANQVVNPTILAVFGILLTLVATSLSLVKGS